MLKESKLRQKTISKEEEVLKEHMFKESQKLFKFRKEEALLMSEISGAQVAARLKKCFASSFPFSYFPSTPTY